MRFYLTGLLWLALAAPAALAQTAAPATTPVSTPAYQFMHVNFHGSRIYFSPAYRGQELVKVQDYLKQQFSFFDEKRLGWEAMSRLLNEFSAEGWELVSMLPDNDKDGNQGAVYLLRKLR